MVVGMKDKEVLTKVIVAQDEYIQLLADELDEIVGLAYAHGWRSNRHELGKAHRDKIQRLKTEAGLEVQP